MKNKLNKNITKIYISIFIFILIILFLSPISGDDWGNYLEGSEGFSHMIGEAIGMYFSWEGRFASRVLINILTYNKVLWNIVNSLVIVGIIYYINKIVKFKNKQVMLISTFLIILFMNIYTFSQVVTWVAGNITYLFVIPLILMYMYILYYNKDKSKKINALLLFLNIIIPMFVEHMAVLLILLNFYFIAKYYYKNKKVNKKYVIFMIISIISFLIMYFSPGNAIRSATENIEFNKLSLFGKMIYNIPNFIIYTYEINYSLIFILVISNCILIKKYVKNLIIRIILYILEAISMIFTFIYLLNSFGFGFIQNNHNIFVILYYLVLTIINFVLIIINSKCTKNELPIVFYIMGILSNVIMLMSPTWGYRTSFATYLFLSVCYLIVIDENFKSSKIKNIFIAIITILGTMFYLIFYINVRIVNQNNEKIIEEAKKKHLEKIELIQYPSFAPCNINPGNEYHLRKFKEYYHIDKNVEIEIVDNNWKYIIIYEK